MFSVPKKADLALSHHYELLIHQNMLYIYIDNIWYFVPEINTFYFF